MGEKRKEALGEKRKESLVDAADKEPKRMETQTSAYEVAT